MADGRFPDKSAMDILKSVQQMTEPVQCICRWWCILAQPGEYDWTIRVLHWCNLMSTDLDHLL